jgi:nucleoside 2-deoxyribosyltransferase
MNRGTVYLAGLISTEFPESLQWRIAVTPVLKEAGFQVLSPMRGKENLAHTSPDGGVTDMRLTPKDIILRDFNDVSRSDVLLTHLESFGSPRPLVGTLYELSWAWYLRTPVVAIIRDANRLMLTHPFVIESVAHSFAEVDDAVDFLIQHYGRY